MTTDLLAPLLDLAGVPEAVAETRDRVDEALRHRALRRQGGQVAAEVNLRSAVASAALEGHGYDLEAVRSGTVTDPVVQGALRVAGALGGLADRWLSSPPQVLARLHVLAASGSVPESELGRPALAPVLDRAGAARLDALAPALDRAGAARLDALARLVAGGTQAPPLVLAAVVHAELLALRPFAGPSGLVARAAARLTLIARGLDPRGLLAVEVGHLAREPEYVGAAGAFATGTRDGLRAWLRHYTAAVSQAAAELTTICSSVASSRP